MLTEKQQKILEYITNGFTDEEIAQKMCFSLSTIKQQLHDIYKNFNVKNRVQATLIFLRDYRNVDFKGIV